ncbi:hypothetical protein MASR1M48_16700 [Lactococcus petauri]
MERNFSGAWKGPVIVKLMLLVKMKSGQTFIITPYSFLPACSEIESVEKVTMGYEDNDQFQEE